MKAVILYASVHHGNTKKVVEAMAPILKAQMIDLTEQRNFDLFGYDLIGFASGIFYGAFHQAITSYIAKASFGKGQRVFLANTCGIAYCSYAKRLQRQLAERGVPCVGSFQCRGYDTFGIWQKIGGIAKKHPDHADLKRAQEFARDLLPHGAEYEERP